MKARFHYGQQVRALRDVHPDGTSTETSGSDCSIPRGAVGYVSDVNTRSDRVVYYVDFADYYCSVGCRERDLMDAEIPYTQYEVDDQVTLMAGLSVSGELIAPVGSLGRVVGIERDPSGDTHYYVRVQSQTFLVPQTLLERSRIAKTGRLG